MLIPRRTKIERTGIVVSIASLLAIAIGLLAVAPETFVWASRTSSVPLAQSRAVWFDDCFASIDVQLPERPERLAGEGSRFSMAKTMAVLNACQKKFDSQFVYRPRSLMEYVPAYTYTIATTVTSPETLNMSGLLLGGATYEGDSASPLVSESVFKVLKLMLYWGVRFLLVGLFLLYFDPTLGRIVRFIWRGSSHA
jgi:hypothetical protein